MSLIGLNLSAPAKRKGARPRKKPSKKTQKKITLGMLPKVLFQRRIIMYLAIGIAGLVIEHFYHVWVAGTGGECVLGAVVDRILFPEDMAFLMK